MSSKLGVLYALFISFLGFTLYSLAATDQPFFEWALGLLSVPATAQVVIDLYLACGLILAWMYYDTLNRQGSIKVWFLYAVLTLFTGSLALLVYLIMREHQSLAAKST